MATEQKEMTETFLERMGFMLTEARRKNKAVAIGPGDFAKLLVMAKSWMDPETQKRIHRPDMPRRRKSVNKAFEAGNVGGRFKG